MKKSKAKLPDEKLTVHGVTRTYAEWAERRRISVRSIAARLRAGWLPEEIVAFQGDLFSRSET